MTKPRLDESPTETLTPLIESIVSGISRHLRQHLNVYRWLLVAVLALVLSPLVLFNATLADRQTWSEIIKNAVETCAVMAAAFAIVQWVNARSDRGTDVLLALEKEFREPEVVRGRELVEDGDYCDPGRSDPLDAMLRFYVLLYAVNRARQVSEESLSICFRYWLAHYFRSDRAGFRSYVDHHFPTLSIWLRRDCGRGLPFFRARRFFGDKIDQEFINSCPELPP